MGLNRDGIRFLLTAKRNGVDFTRTATLGRQGMHLTAQELNVLLYEFGYTASGQYLVETGYCERFLEMLGAKQVVSFDSSAYENATTVHNFNTHLAPEKDCAYDEYFTTVLDSGSLEHIFNVPVALSNLMRMVQVGGHLLLNTPSNCASGHGLYQFSPDLFFRALSPENGFAIDSILLSDNKGSWQALPDPAVCGHRVGPGVVYVDGREAEAPNQKLALLLVTARRTQAVHLFTKPVQQAEYA